MDPFTLALILGGGGALLGGLGSLPGLGKDPYLKTEKPTNINPWSQGVFNQMQGQYGNLNNLFQQSLGDSRTAGQGDFDQSRNLLSQLSSLSFDPMAAQRSFMSQVPGLQNIAQSSIGDGSTENELQRHRTQMGEDAASRFGGSPTSAAFQQSVMRASAEPAFQYSANRDAQQAQLLQSLMGQTMGNLNQSYLQDHAMKSQNLAGAAQGFQGLGGMSQQAELARMGQLGQMLSQFGGILGQYGAPTMWAPNLINNPEYTSPGDLMQNMLGGTETGLKFAGMF